MSFDFDIQSISKVCKTKNGICSRSGEPHELLSGAAGCPTDKLHLLDDKVKARAIAEASKLKPGATITNSSIWKTKLTEPYPHELCDAVAKVMAKHLTHEDVCFKHEPRANSQGILCPNINLKPPTNHYLIHFPKHPGCEACKLSKQMKARSGKVRNEDRVHFEKKNPSIWEIS